MLCCDTDADRKAKQLAQDLKDEKHKITKDVSTVELTVTTTTLASSTNVSIYFVLGTALAETVLYNLL